MTRGERAAWIVASAAPASPAGRRLLKEYHRRCDVVWPEWPQRERLLLWELRRVVEADDFGAEPTRESIERIRELPSASMASATRRRLLSYRLGRMLDDQRLVLGPGLASSTWLPSWSVAVAVLDPEAALPLEGWLRHRATQLAAHQLKVEMRRLVRLERHRSQDPDRPVGALIESWMRTEVRMIADCGCPPVTRLRDPLRCHSLACGAIAADVGLTPSPGAYTQRRMRAVARRYLATREWWRAEGTGR